MSRDRDRILEQALKHELRAAGTPDRDACLDAETLGAWADGGLDAAAMAAVEAHVSNCARCQAIVGVAARSAPVIAPATNDRLVSISEMGAGAGSRGGGDHVWMVVPQDTMQAPPAPAPVAARSQRSRMPRSAPPQPAQAQRAAIAGESAPTPAAQQPRRAPRSVRRSEARARARRPRRKPGAPAATRGTTPAAVARAVAAPAPPAAPPRAEAPAAASCRRARDSRRIEIVSPDPSRRWRIVSGAIERSEDGGASWIATRSRSGWRLITGGTAPAAIGLLADRARAAW